MSMGVASPGSQRCPGPGRPVCKSFCMSPHVHMCSCLCVSVPHRCPGPGKPSDSMAFSPLYLNTCTYQTLQVDSMRLK